MVSKGTMKVASIIENTTACPFHFKKTKEKAEREQRNKEKTMVIPVINTELKMKKNGTSLKILIIN